jgi:hypothetical protein
MDIHWFQENVKPRLQDCSFTYSSFSGGQFGDLERVELEGDRKLGTVEFWSEGWLGIDVYDLDLDDQVMNTLLSPEEKHLVGKVIERMINLMSSAGDEADSLSRP